MPIYWKPPPPDTIKILDLEFSKIFNNPDLLDMCVAPPPEPCLYKDANDIFFDDLPPPL